MCPFMQHDKIDPKAIAYLNVLGKDAQIVISSSWRIWYQKDEIVERLREKGWTGQLHDDWQTPELDKNKNHGHRTKEIMAWLRDHKDVKHFVILDDQPEFFSNGNHLVITPGILTEANYRQARAWLARGIMPATRWALWKMRRFN